MAVISTLAASVVDFSEVVPKSLIFCGCPSAQVAVRPLPPWPSSVPSEAQPPSAGALITAEGSEPARPALPTCTAAALQSEPTGIVPPVFGWEAYLGRPLTAHRQ